MGVSALRSEESECDQEMSDSKKGVELPDGRRAMMRPQSRQPGTEPIGESRSIRNTPVAYHPGGHPECPGGGVSGDHESA